MIKKGFIISILIFVCLGFFCCTSIEWKEWEENKDYYQIFIEENDSFYDYHFITLMNYDHQIFHLLSKEIPKNEKPPFEEYEKIKSGFYYKVKLKKIDSIIVLKQKFANVIGGGIIILLEEINDETIEIWSDDTLRVPAYTSENIYGLYREILE